LLKNKIPAFNELCEYALSEYIYCKTLLGSIYNQSGKLECPFDCNCDCSDSSQSENIKDLHRFALNIENSINYIKHLKVRNWDYLINSQSTLAQIYHQESYNNLRIIHNNNDEIAANNIKIADLVTETNIIVNKNDKLGQISLKLGKKSLILGKESKYISIILGSLSIGITIFFSVYSICSNEDIYIVYDKTHNINKIERGIKQAIPNIVNTKGSILINKENTYSTNYILQNFKISNKRDIDKDFYWYK
jgi:hypothetical protein